MKEKKKSKWLGFFLAMVLYALVVLLAGGLGMKYLWDFAAEYEKELPAYKMNDYVGTLNQNHVRKLALDFVDSLDRNIQSEEDAHAEIWKCFVGGVRYQQVESSADGQSVTYLISNKEHALGRVTLVKNGEGLGEKTWSVGEESYDFSFLINSERFVVPDQWVVYCGARRLGVQYIIDPRVEYSFLDVCYGLDFPMPYLAEYEIGNYIGDPKIRFFDPDGNERPRFTFTDGREQILRVTGRTRETFADFAETFVPLYVNCLSNITKNAGTNYQRIRPYLVPNSELDTRLKAAFGGQQFTQSNGTDISDVRIHDVYNLGSEFFIIDLSYSVNTYSAKGESVSDTDMYLVVYRDEEELKAYTVRYY